MSQISYVIEFTINDGQTDALRSKAEAYIAAAQENEPGTLAYQWYLNADGTTCVLVERFENSGAVMTHLGNIGPSLPELLAVAPITRFEVLGDASDEVRGALADLGAIHFAHLGGFDR